MRLLCTSMAAMLLLAAAPVQAHHDDYPDEGETPLDVAPGTYAGTFGPGADGDRLRLTHPVGKAVRATIVTPKGAAYVLTLHNDAGAYLDNGQTIREEGDIRTYVRYGNAPAGVVVRINSYTEEAVPYTLTLEVVDLPDLAILDLRVRSASLATPLGVQEHPTLRHLEIDVANLGGAGTLAHLFVWVDGRAGRADVLGLGLDLAPHEVRTYRFSWNGVGLGDVTFRALLLGSNPPFEDPDLDGSNYGRSAAHHLVAGGLGAGVVLPL